MKNRNEVNLEDSSDSNRDNWLSHTNFNEEINMLESIGHSKKGLVISWMWL